MEMPTAWLELLGQLQHMIDQTEGCDARRAFQGLGHNRHAAAQRQLRMQQRRLTTQAMQWGIAVDACAVNHAASSLPDLVDMGAEYRFLADRFASATEVARLHGNARLATWLSQRGRLHLEHSLLLTG